MNLQEQIATITKLVWEGDYTGGAMLPAEIGKFKNLTLLSLCFTAEITELPKELANCQALEMLFISSRHLQQIPRTIGELKVLKKLELVDCDLRGVPSELGTCRALEELTLSGNRNLEALPEEIGQLARLNKLNAMGNNWEAKWNRGADTHKKLHERARHILRYSSMPGTSRHHWGTDVDINSVESDYFASPKGKKEYEWLITHAKTYGFFQPYTPKGLNRPEGYEEEEWHWSYAPLSDQFMREYASRIG